jgi:tRNA nucleotidyltransferase (CCA-adding enzyme)
MNPPLPIIDPRHLSTLAKPFLVSPALKLLLTTLSAAGGRGILVGGCVRDHLLGLTHQDLDIEVYGITAASLEKILTKDFSVVAVGKSFGIFKVNISDQLGKHVFDVSLPRRENKAGFGHKGFVIATDPKMSFSDAASRRDFTINAMGIDPINQQLLDPHGGKKDLKDSRLKHVSEAFKEDPLRVLRAAQFCARFNLFMDETTIDECILLSDELSTLSQERIYWEMKKLLLSQKPSIGLEVLRKVEALVLFPELAQLIGCTQDSEWHPEGDVWVHSLMVTDQAAKIVANSNITEDEKMIVMVGALCHDLGKPSTTILKDGRIKSPAHEQAGIEPTRQFLTAMGFPKKFHDEVCALVADHLKPHQLYRARDEVSDGAIRRLAARVNIDHLLMVSTADFLGRTTKEALDGYDPSADWLQKKLLDLLGGDKKPQPILLGRHLIALGKQPGVEFSRILSEAFEAQMDGQFADEASGLLWLKKYLNMA